MWYFHFILAVVRFGTYLAERKKTQADGACVRAAKSNHLEITRGFLDNR